METKNSFCICIPTLNRADLLIPSLLNYSLNYPNTPVLIYDNGKQEIMEKLVDIENKFKCYEGLKNVVVYGNIGKNIGVAASWNFLLKKAFLDHTHALVLNDDVYLHKNETQVNSLLYGVEKYYFKGILLPESNYNWSSLIIDKATFETVGEFDENFYPAYYEDSDYMHRMDKIDEIGLKHIQFLKPDVYNNSMTLEKDMSLLELTAKSKDYYISKWGGLPGDEKFEIPFNKNKSE